MSKQANVYKSPSFDAKVLVRLKEGRKVLGTKKTVAGTDGFGLFHKVRLRKGLYGYILDTSVKGFKPEGIFNKRKKKSGGFFSRRRDSNQIYSSTKSRSFGLSYTFMDYSIQASDQTLNSGSSLFGLKFTGPWLSPGLPLDIGLSVSPGAPSLLDTVSTEASGFFAFLDVSYQFVVFKSLKSEAYWSLAPALSYYSFDITFNGETESRDSSQLDFGVSVGAGYAYNISDFVLRLEAKYLRTNDAQLAGTVSLQRYF